MNFLLVTTALFLFTALQARLPTLGWLGGLRLEFLPALVAYGALTFRHRRWALTLAIAAGFFQDALSAGPFGSTVAAYVVATFLLIALARNFDREAIWMPMLGGALASVAASAAAGATIGFTAGSVAKLLLLALLSGAVAPLVFLTLDSLRYRTRPV